MAWATTYVILSQKSVPKKDEGLLVEPIRFLLLGLCTAKYKKKNKPEGLRERRTQKIRGIQRVAESVKEHRSGLNIHHLLILEPP